MTHDRIQSPQKAQKLRDFCYLWSGMEDKVSQSKTVQLLQASGKQGGGELVPTVRKQADLPTERSLQYVLNKDDILVLFFSILRLGPHVRSCQFTLCSTLAFITTIIK